MSLGGFCDLICHVKKALLMSENELFSTLISSKTSAAIWLSLSKNTQLCHSHVVDLFKLSQTYPWLMEFFFVIFRRYFVVYCLLSSPLLRAHLVIVIFNNQQIVECTSLIFHIFTVIHWQDHRNGRVTAKIIHIESRTVKTRNSWLLAIDEKSERHSEFRKNESY